MLLKPITTWQEREWPKRTVNIFLAGYVPSNEVVDFMILWVQFYEAVD